MCVCLIVKKVVLVPWLWEVCERRKEGRKKKRNESRAPTLVLIPDPTSSRLPGRWHRFHRIGGPAAAAAAARCRGSRRFNFWRVACLAARRIIYISIKIAMAVLF